MLRRSTRGCVSVVSDQEWEERKPAVQQRHRRIGGTEIGILCGIASFGKTPRDVYNRIVLGEDSFTGNAFSDRGIKYEPVVRGMYVQETGAALVKHPGMLLFEDWAAASMDDVFQRRRIGPVDYKTASVKGMSKWKKHGQWTMPANYEYQLRHYMAVMNALGMLCDCAELFVAFGVDEKDAAHNYTGVFTIKETKLLHIDRDLDLEHHMLATGRAFWKNHIVTKTPPVDGRDRDLVKVSDMKLSKAEMEFLGMSEPAPEPAPVARKMLIEDQSTTPDMVACSPTTIQQGAPYQLPSGKTGTFISMTEGRFSFKVDSGIELLEQGTMVLPLPAILPPDAPASHPELAVDCPQCEPRKDGKPNQHLLADCPTKAVAEAPAPTKRTRRTAKQMANDAAQVIPEGRADRLREISHLGQAETMPEQPTDSALSLHLYVNALPGPGVEAKPLAPYVDLIARKLAEVVGCQDIRASDAKQLAFGKWKGELASFVRGAPPAPGVYYALTSESELVQIAVEALSALCAPGFPVRGVR